MWILTTIALAALLWLVQITLGTDPEAYSLVKPESLIHAALGLSVLASVLVLQRLLIYALQSFGRSGNGIASDLLQALISIILYLVAAMLYLSFGLGLDISSVLATSAVLSVIIGLALQPTLGNLFAGVSIEIERPLRVGDFVRSAEMQGQVISLSWRSVYLRTEFGSVVVMPNSELNSRLLEVISADQPYRCNVNFNIASDLPPGQVIRVAMQVLCSGLSGICSTPSPSVVVLGTDSATGTLRYAARFFTLPFLACTSISSDCLERLWYALSREGLQRSAWWPSPELHLAAPQIRQKSGVGSLIHPTSSLNSLCDELSESADQRQEEDLSLPASCMAALANIGEKLQHDLLSNARLLRYGQYERCDSGSLILVHQGCLTESRPSDAQHEQATFLALMHELEHTSKVTGSPRLNKEIYQILLQDGTLALGPMALNLCQRIAALTADSYMAYRVFSEFISQPILRDQFLTKAQLQPSRSVGVGDWLGWAHVLNLEPKIIASCSSHGCSLLVWSPAVLRTILNTALPTELEALSNMLREQETGCGSLSVLRLQSWLQSA